ncbi:MAG: hypothetical protein ABI583_00240 [Betaproteobacteria bacterium]
MSRPTTTRHQKIQGVEPSADASLAGISAAALSGYRSLLPPVIPAGVIPGRIAQSNPHISVNTCLALYEAGWNAIGARDKITPDRWLKETLQHYLEPMTNAKTVSGHTRVGMDLDIHINSDDDEQIAWIGMQESHQGVGFTMIGDLAMKAEAFQPGLGARFIDALGADSWVITPARAFEMASYLCWHGEDDEACVIEELGAEEIYQGIRRADFDKTYPKWAYHPPANIGAGKQLSEERLRQIADTGEWPFREIARECLAIDALSRAHKRLADSPFGLNLDILGFEDVWAYGAVAQWSPDDNLSEILADEAYQLAMQVNASPYNILLQIPPALTPAKARLLIQTLESYVGRFAAVARLLSLAQR